MAVTRVGLVLLSALLSMALGSWVFMVCKMSNRSPVDQLLPLVVRSNASPNSWPVLASNGFFLCAFVTSVHGAEGAVVPAKGLSWLICSVSTAWVMVSSAIMKGVVLVLVCPVRVSGGKARAVLLSGSTVDVSWFMSGRRGIDAGFVLCSCVSVNFTALGMSFISLLGVS